MTSVKESVDQMHKGGFYFCKRIGIVPNHPREIDLFVLGLTFLILLFCDSTLLQDLIVVANSSAENSKGGGVILVLFFAALGSPLAIYAAFARRKIGSFIKSFLNLFYIVINISIAITLAYYIFRNPTISNSILGAWQVLRIIALFVFTGKNSAGDYYLMPTRNAYKGELILATITLACLVIVGLQKDWYWVVTFSAVLFWWQMIESFVIRHPFTRAVYRAK